MLVEHKVPKMHILQRNESSQATGLVVVIDVLRAFTTAAYALGSGAEKIILTSKIDEAKALAKAIPGSLTIGEDKGKHIQGFDFDNSPWSINGHDLTGKIMIQRTSSGTQGITQCSHCTHILASSFVVAEATIARIQALAPPTVYFLITGSEDGSEDMALAEYFQARLNHTYEGPMGPYLRKVSNSPAGRFLQQHHDEYPLSDLDAALAVDSFPFAMEAFKEGGLMVLQPVKTNGHIWR